MSGPDDTPPHGIPIVSAPPQAAFNRPGETAPVHDADHLPPPPDDLMGVLEAARELRGRFRSFNQYVNEPEFRLLHPGLREFAARMERCVRAKLNDDYLMDLLLEAKNLLPHSPPHD